MLRYDLFRALNPSKNYPSTLHKLSLIQVPYDLVLPPDVCDMIFDCNIESKHARVDHLCSPAGIARARADVTLLSHPEDLPAFAGCEVRQDVTGSDFVTGYALHLLVFNEEFVRTLFVRPVVHGSLADCASQWIRSHLPYVGYCGGFEVARYLCYSTPEEKAEVEKFVSRVAYGGEADDLLEKNVRKVRFRDMVDNLQVG